MSGVQSGAGAGAKENWVVMEEAALTEDAAMEEEKETEEEEQKSKEAEGAAKAGEEEKMEAAEKKGKTAEPGDVEEAGDAAKEATTEELSEEEWKVSVAAMVAALEEVTAGQVKVEEERLLVLRQIVRAVNYGDHRLVLSAAQHGAVIAALGGHKLSDAVWTEVRMKLLEYQRELAMVRLAEREKKLEEQTEQLKLAEQARERLLGEKGKMEELERRNAEEEQKRKAETATAWGEAKRMKAELEDMRRTTQGVGVAKPPEGKEETYAEGMERMRATSVIPGQKAAHTFELILAGGSNAEELTQVIEEELQVNIEDVEIMGPKITRVQGELVAKWGVQVQLDMSRVGREAEAKLHQRLAAIAQAKGRKVPEAGRGTRMPGKLPDVKEELKKEDPGAQAAKAGMQQQGAKAAAAGGQPADMEMAVPQELGDGWRRMLDLVQRGENYFSGLTSDEMLLDLE